MKKQLSIWLKGLAMGAADVVPGVSGGTIAFVTGIYPELIKTIDGLGLYLIKDLRKKGIKQVWKQANLGFLFPLIFGIGCSILTLAKLLNWTLEHHPILLWAFFFGLVVASILHIVKQLDRWSVGAIVLAVIFAVISYSITTMTGTQGTEGLMAFFFAGFIAIIAMILPGISGAFILLLMGMYQQLLMVIENLLTSLSTGDMALFQSSMIRVILFAIGAVLGLKLFSKALNWLFTYHRNMILAVLVGFMIGSLNKIWPWKEVLEEQLIHGKMKVISERSVLPYLYEGDTQLWGAILLSVVGFGVVLLLEKFSAPQSATHKD